MRTAVVRAAMTVVLAGLSAVDLAQTFKSRVDTVRLDVLVLNAGALTHAYTVTDEANETTLATHVLSPFLLTRGLRPLLEASAPSRVIVVASGGMYTEPLDVDALDPGPTAYDGTKAYARCKRAQVVLAEEWLSVSSPSGIVLSGSTKAVLVTSIGRFGLNALIVIVRKVGAPFVVVTRPERVAPTQLTTPPE